jgi:type IV pilus assembly protein PilC
MFKSFQVELPFSTRIVLRISETIMSYGVYMFLAMVILIISFRSSLRSSFIRQKIEGYVYRLPFLGGILVKNQVARFCRTLGTLLQAQVSLVDALEVTRRIFSNEEIRSEIARITQYVRQGRTIAEPLVESRFFPRMVSQMIAVGEETSELDAMLLKVAEYYEKEIDGKVETLSSVIEPVIIVLLGFLVGGILISIYMPMFDLVNVVGGQ